MPFILFDICGDAAAASHELLTNGRLTVGTAACPEALARPTLASTGAVGLSGRVTRIDGLREKAIAAYETGVSAFIIPKVRLVHVTKCKPLHST